MTVLKLRFPPDNNRRVEQAMDPVMAAGGLAVFNPWSDRARIAVPAGIEAADGYSQRCYQAAKSGTQLHYRPLPLGKSVGKRQPRAARGDRRRPRSTR